MLLSASTRMYPKMSHYYFLSEVTFTLYLENQDEHEDELPSAASMRLLLGTGPIMREPR